MRTKYIFIALISVSSMYSQNTSTLFAGGHYGYQRPHVNQSFHQLTGIKGGASIPLSQELSFITQIEFNHFIPFKYGMDQGYQNFESSNPHESGEVIARGHAIMVGLGVKIKPPQSNLFLRTSLNFGYQYLSNEVLLTSPNSSMEASLQLIILQVNPDIAVGYRHKLSDKKSLDLALGYTATIASEPMANYLGFNVDQGEFYRMNYLYLAVSLNFGI